MNEYVNHQVKLTWDNPKHDKVVLSSQTEPLIRVTYEGQVLVKGEHSTDPAEIGKAFLEWVDAWNKQ